MKKLLGSLCLLAILLSFAPAARAAIIPREGHYAGQDQYGTSITFQYSRAHGMSKFTIDYSFTIGGAAHVSNAMWHQTCHNGHCTSGAWAHNATVHGHYYHVGHHSKVAWTVHWVRGF